MGESKRWIGREVSILCPLFSYNGTFYAQVLIKDVTKHEIDFNRGEGNWFIDDMSEDVAVFVD